jgi:hypothetical protein
MSGLSQDTYLNASVPLTIIGGGSGGTSNPTFSTATISSLDVTGQANITFLETAQISSIYGEFEELSCSSISTLGIILDGAILTTAGGNELLLNGIPVATTQNISSLADWSFDPAVSTLNMNGNSTINATGYFGSGTVSTTRVQAQTGFISSLVCNDISTMTLTALSTIHSISSISSVEIEAQAGLFSSLAATSASTAQLFVSSVNGQPYVPYVTPSTISLGDWAQFPANSTVNLAGNPLHDDNGPLVVAANAGNLELTGDRGLNVTTGSVVSMTAKNGNGGTINILADSGAGFINGGAVNITANGGSGAGLNGRVSLTANGGTAGSVGVGGVLELIANSATGTFSNATSKVSMSGGGVNIYSGIGSPFASVFGYTFLNASLGVSLVAGAWTSGFQVPGSVFLYGTSGIVHGSDTYLTNVYPVWDGLTTPQNIMIAGRYTTLSGTGYVALSTVSSIAMAGGGAITGVNTINGQPYVPGGGGGGIQSTIAGGTGSYITINSGTAGTNGNILISTSQDVGREQSVFINADTDIDLVSRNRIYMSSASVTAGSHGQFNADLLGNTTVSNKNYTAFLALAADETSGYGAPGDVHLFTNIANTIEPPVFPSTGIISLFSTGTINIASAAGGRISGISTINGVPYVSTPVTKLNGLIGSLNIQSTDGFAIITASGSNIDLQRGNAVGSLNGQIGAVTLAQGNNLEITSTTGSIAIAGSADVEFSTINMNVAGKINAHSIEHPAGDVGDLIINQANSTGGLYLSVGDLGIVGIDQFGECLINYNIEGGLQINQAGNTLEFLPTSGSALQGQIVGLSTINGAPYAAGGAYPSIADFSTININTGGGIGFTANTGVLVGVSSINDAPYNSNPVSSINGQTGAITLIQGTGIEITSTAGAFTITNVGGGTVSGVASLNALTGALDLTSGDSSVTITSTATTIDLSVAFPGPGGVTKLNTLAGELDITSVDASVTITSTATTIDLSVVGAGGYSPDPVYSTVTVADYLTTAADKDGAYIATSILTSLPGTSLAMTSGGGGTAISTIITLDCVEGNITLNNVSQLEVPVTNLAGLIIGPEAQNMTFPQDATSAFGVGQLNNVSTINGLPYVAGGSGIINADVSTLTVAGGAIDGGIAGILMNPTTGITQYSNPISFLTNTSQTVADGITSIRSGPINVYTDGINSSISMLFTFALSTVGVNTAMASSDFYVKGRNAFNATLDSGHIGYDEPLSTMYLEAPLGVSMSTLSVSSIGGTVTIGVNDGLVIDGQSLYTAPDNQTGVFFGTASSLGSYLKLKTSAGQVVDMQAGGGVWIDTFTTLEGTPIPATGLFLTNTGMYFNSTLIYGS